MTAPASVKLTDLRRAALISNETGCKIMIEVKSRDMVITVFPEDKAPQEGRIINGIDFSQPIL